MPNEEQADKNSLIQAIKSMDKYPNTEAKRERMKIELKKLLIDGKDQISAFEIDVAMLVQMKGDVKARLFNEEELPETFLNLRNQITIDYTYQINAKMDKKKLKSKIYTELQKTREEVNHIWR